MKLFVLRVRGLEREFPSGEDPVSPSYAHYITRDNCETPPEGISRDEWPWKWWYDKIFGFVVRAETEEDARKLASKNNANEGRQAWLDPRFSTCTELAAEGPAEVILYHPEWA